MAPIGISTSATTSSSKLAGGSSRGGCSRTPPPPPTPRRSGAVFTTTCPEASIGSSGGMSRGGCTRAPPPPSHLASNGSVAMTRALMNSASSSICCRSVGGGRSGLRTRYSVMREAATGAGRMAFSSSRRRISSSCNGRLVSAALSLPRVAAARRTAHGNAEVSTSDLGGNSGSGASPGGNKLGTTTRAPPPAASPNCSVGVEASCSHI